EQLAGAFLGLLASIVGHRDSCVSHNHTPELSGRTRAWRPGSPDLGTETGETQTSHAHDGVDVIGRFGVVFTHPRQTTLRTRPRNQRPWAGSQPKWSTAPRRRR